MTGDLTAQQGILLSIPDTIFGSTGNFTGGHIDGNAILTLDAQNITTPSTNSGIPGTDTMAIEASIYPNASGTVGGDAIVNVSASQNISAPGSILFWVANGNYLDLGGSTIGGNATVNVSAASLSSGDLFVQILNYGGASIGGDAVINVTTDTLSVGGSLDSTINNSNSGTIGGNAAINMNVSGSATVTNDATFQILGSDGAASAAINFNGGSYDAGGTFLAFIDGEERSHSIMPAFTQMCSKLARSAQTVCLISAAACFRLIRRWSSTLRGARASLISFPTSRLAATA